MLEYLIFCILLIDTLVPPQPTAEMNALVAKMGDDDFFVRKEANKKLEDMGYAALKALEKGTLNPDAEIAMRCRRTLEKYYDVCSDCEGKPYPFIWNMPNDRINGDFDLAVSYYEKARAMKNRGLRDWEKIEATNWWDTDTCQLATQLYIKDILRMGVTRQVAKKRLNQMVDIDKYGYYTNWAWNSDRPPGKVNKCAHAPKKLNFDKFDE